jgi:hypothetical protein
MIMFKDVDIDPFQTVSESQARAGTLMFTFPILMR